MRAVRQAFGALVISMPPSPVVMILTGWKLNTVTSLRSSIADLAPAVVGAHRVRGVFDDVEAVAVRERADLHHLAGLPGEMHRAPRPSASGPRLPPARAFRPIAATLML